MSTSAKIESYAKICCDFCGEKTPFKNLRQVPLKIDKNSKNQHIFAFQCEPCMRGNKKVTLEHQKIKSFVGKYKPKNESSIFDGEDGGE
jgi:hypothetical protein